MSSAVAAPFTFHRWDDMPLEQMRQVRGSRISMVFQEPMTSLNPVFTIGMQVMEVIHRLQNVNRHVRDQCAFRIIHPECGRQLTPRARCLDGEKFLGAVFRVTCLATEFSLVAVTTRSASSVVSMLSPSGPA